MSIQSFITLLLLSWGCFLATAQAEEVHLVDHIDVITIDPQLNLVDLVNQTLEKYPDQALIAAMQKESEALNLRGNRWIAGAPTVSIDYKDDFVGSDTGAYELEGAVEVPIWNWGQRDAGLRLAEQAALSVANKGRAIKLQVAGLVRQSLWMMSLETLRHDVAEKNLHLTEKLLKTIQLRVEVGDLPKSDFLLAESEFLQKKIELIHAEAELMHARKRFYFLTQDTKIPAQINEPQSDRQAIDDSHPALATINAIVAQKKAKVEWVKAEGSGQTTLAVGGNTDKPSSSEQSIDSITFSVSMPFGGRGYAVPEIAAAQTEYAEAETEKMHLYRHLLEQLHEAEHELEIEKVQLKISTQMKSNAEEHLKMANSSFKAGEINLMDFLKIQARSLKAIKNAAESAIRLQRDIALYNQAVGVAP
jgi:outer membrane protein TolC